MKCGQLEKILEEALTSIDHSLTIMGTIPHRGVQVPVSKEAIPYTVSSPVIHGYIDIKLSII